jgi:hypothetical protein
MDHEDCSECAGEAPGDRGPQGPTHARLFGPGVTISDLTAWARTRFPATHFDLRGGAPSAIAPTLEQLEHLARLYPEVSVRIERFRLEDLPTGTGDEPDVLGRSLAALPNRPSSLALNRAYFSRPGRLARRLAGMVHRGWHPRGTARIDSVVTHEFGHHVWFMLEEEGFDPRSFMAAQTHDLLTLSQYASRRGAGGGEAWAEAFVAHCLGDDDARSHPLTCSVVQFIERSIRELRARRGMP